MRLGIGAGILLLLVAQVGGGPFVDGLRATDPGALSAAVAITALTTVCCAWRWQVVARGLGVELALPAAIRAYYRSQFLNATLPAGVLGDVHRAITHGREIGSLGRGLRSVVWDRVLGQAVQIGLTLGLLLVLPTPLRSTALSIAIAAVAIAMAVTAMLVLVVRRVPRDLLRVLDTRRARLSIVLASIVATTGHTAVFVIAAEISGATVPPATILAVALVVLLASSVPANVAGWGPREGAAAWAFVAVGLTAAQGVTASVVYGVMALVATLPGALLLVASRRPATASPALSTAPLEDAAHG